MGLTGIRPRWGQKWHIPMGQTYAKRRKNIRRVPRQTSALMRGIIAQVVIDPGPRSQRYRDLCHVVIMAKAGSFEASLDALVAAILAQENRPGGLTTGQLRLEVQGTFGTSLPENLIGQALQRGVNRREIIHIRATDCYAVEPASRKTISDALQEARALEASVRRDWLAMLEPPIAENSEAATELWAVLIDYTARAFRRHGVEMQMLINPDPGTAMPGTSLHGLLKAAVEENARTVDAGDAMKAVYRFFADPSPERTRYITSLLDATFTVYALGADKGLTEYLRGLTRRVSLFVDTNFIFAILGLHENALVEVSKQLVELVVNQGLPVELVVHSDTMREFQHQVSLARHSLGGGRQWSQAVSAALVQTDELSAIERRFHADNSKAPTDLTSFFLQFADAAVLKQMNAKVYRRKQPRDQSELTDLRSLEQEYSTFVQSRGVGRTQDAIAHDVSVLTDVARLQHRGATVTAVRALFLTTDFRLFDFDWAVCRGPGSVGTAILPSQFLQLVRPFMSVTDDFNTRFVKTFALPEVRIVAADHIRAIGMLASLLSALPGIDEKTAVRVVTDDVLVERLSGLVHEPDAFAKLVTETIGLENKALVIERDSARDEARRYAAMLDEAARREAELRDVIEKAVSAEASGPESRTKEDRTAYRAEPTSNPWRSGSFYLVSLIITILVAAVLAWLFIRNGVPAAGAVAIAIAILLACVGALIVIGTMQQTQDRTLSAAEGFHRLELGLRAIGEALRPSSKDGAGDGQVR